LCNLCVYFLVVRALHLLAVCATVAEGLPLAQLLCSLF
jgi:hypothetical protein